MFEQFFIYAASALIGYLACDIKAERRLRKLSDDYHQRVVKQCEQTAEIQAKRYEQAAELRKLSDEVTEWKERHHEAHKGLVLSSERLEEVEEELSAANETIESLEEKCKKLSQEGQEETIGELLGNISKMRQDYVTMAESANAEISRLNKANNDYQAALADVINKNQSLIAILEKTKEKTQ